MPSSGSRPGSSLSDPDSDDEQQKTLSSQRAALVSVSAIDSSAIGNAIDNANASDNVNAIDNIRLDVNMQASISSLHVDLHHSVAANNASSSVSNIDAGSGLVALQSSRQVYDTAVTALSSPDLYSINDSVNVIKRKQSISSLQGVLNTTLSDVSATLQPSDFSFVNNRLSPTTRSDSTVQSVDAQKIRSAHLHTRPALPTTSIFSLPHVYEMQRKRVADATSSLNRYASKITVTPLHKVVRQAPKVVNTRDWTESRSELKRLRVLERVAKLKQANKWSFRQLSKHHAPLRDRSHWDILLEEMKWLQVDFRQERRWKIATAWQVAQWVMQWHLMRNEEKSSNIQHITSMNIATNDSQTLTFDNIRKSTNKPTFIMDTDTELSIQPQIDIDMNRTMNAETLAQQTVIVMPDDLILSGYTYSPPNPEELIPYMDEVEVGMVVPLSKLISVDWELPRQVTADDMVDHWDQLERQSDGDICWKNDYIARSLLDHVKVELSDLARSSDKGILPHQHQHNDTLSTMKVCFNKPDIPPPTSIVVTFSTPWTPEEDERLMRLCKGHTCNFELITDALNAYFKRDTLAHRGRHTVQDCLQRYKKLSGDSTQQESIADSSTDGSTDLFEDETDSTDIAKPVIDQHEQLTWANVHYPPPALVKKDTKEIQKTKQENNKRRRVRHNSVFDNFRALFAKAEQLRTRPIPNITNVVIEPSKDARAVPTPLDISRLKWEMEEKIRKEREAREAQMRQMAVQSFNQSNLLRTGIPTTAAQANQLMAAQMMRAGLAQPHAATLTPVQQSQHSQPQIQTSPQVSAQKQQQTLPLHVQRQSQPTTPPPSLQPASHQLQSQQQQQTESPQLQLQQQQQQQQQHQYQQQQQQQQQQALQAQLPLLQQQLLQQQQQQQQHMSQAQSGASSTPTVVSDSPTSSQQPFLQAPHSRSPQIAQQLLMQLPGTNSNVPSSPAHHHQAVLQNLNARLRTPGITLTQEQLANYLRANGLVQGMQPGNPTTVGNNTTSAPGVPAVVQGQYSPQLQQRLSMLQGGRPFDMQQQLFLMRLMQQQQQQQSSLQMRPPMNHIALNASMQQLLQARSQAAAAQGLGNSGTSGVNFMAPSVGCSGPNSMQHTNPILQMHPQSPTDPSAHLGNLHANVIPLGLPPQSQYQPQQQQQQPPLQHNTNTQSPALGQQFVLQQNAGQPTTSLIMPFPPSVTLPFNIPQSPNKLTTQQGATFNIGAANTQTIPLMTSSPFLVTASTIDTGQIPQTIDLTLTNAIATSSISDNSWYMSSQPRNMHSVTEDIAESIDLPNQHAGHAFHAIGVDPNKNKQQLTPAKHRVQKSIELNAQVLSSLSSSSSSPPTGTASPTSIGAITSSGRSLRATRGRRASAVAAALLLAANNEDDDEAQDNLDNGTESGDAEMENDEDDEDHGRDSRTQINKGGRGRRRSKREEESELELSEQDSANDLDDLNDDDEEDAPVHITRRMRTRRSTRK